MHALRSPNVGLAVFFAAAGAVLIFVLPDHRIEGFSLVAETLANGLASAQRDWSMNLRDANTIPPCGVAAVGTALVMFAEPLSRALDVLTQGQITTLGWIVGLAGLAWLIFECAVNG